MAIGTLTFYGAYFLNISWFYKFFNSHKFQEKLKPCVEYQHFWICMEASKAVKIFTFIQFLQHE